jgi:hypothetical protein
MLINKPFTHVTTLKDVKTYIQLDLLVVVMSTSCLKMTLLTSIATIWIPISQLV